MLIFGLSFFLVYGSERPWSIAFDYYQPNTVFFYLKHLVAITPLVTVPFNVIDLADLLQENGLLCESATGFITAARCKTILRLALVTCILFVSEIAPNITVIFKLAGLIAGPLLCLIFPVGQNFQTLLICRIFWNFLI